MTNRSYPPPTKPPFLPKGTRKFNDLKGRNIVSKTHSKIEQKQQSG